MQATHWIVRALAILLAFASTARAQESFRWEQNLEAAKQIAAQSNRLVLVHFYTSSCAPCRELEEQVFSQPGFGAPLVADYVAVKLNAEYYPAVARGYGVETVPSDVIISSDGRLISKMSSPRTASGYVGAMNRIAVDTRSNLNRGYAQAAPPAYGAPSYQQPPAAGTAPGGAAPYGQQAAGNLGSTPAPSRYSDDRYADYYNARGPSVDPVAPPYADQAATGVGPAQYSGYSSPTDPGMQQPGAQQPAQQPTPPNVQFNNAAPGANQFQPPVTAGPSTQPAMEPRAASATQLPAGSPPLGLEGYCPVTLGERQQWTAGDVRWGAVHRGRTYLFTSPGEQQRFLADPDRYAPVLSGNDPVMALDQGQMVSGRREHGVFFAGRVFLFASEETLAVFQREESVARAQQRPHRYVDGIRQLMR